MHGETAHAKGADGTALAKKWLEHTTRAQVWWEQPNPNDVRKLTFARPGGSFSFDMGGILSGGEFHNQFFHAEVKHYKDASNQRKMYREYLAKCFRAYSLSPQRCDQFMWITWSAFCTTEWSKLDSPEMVADSVVEHWYYNYTSLDEAACAPPDPATLAEVADRLWILVLSRKQIDHLTMTREHLGVIARYKVGAEVSR
ncbi:hypothetical protein [Nocardia sp. CA-135398]|uniref:hypothetical protein n=1 Tax=Nocardia sp. CA-135398 TaxID=3239977 RepID=UPI003D95CF90